MEDTDDLDSLAVDPVEDAVGSCWKNACVGKQILIDSAEFREVAESIDVLPQLPDIPSGSDLSPSSDSPTDEVSQVGPCGDGELKMHQRIV